MINPGISAVWSKTKQIAHSLVHHVYKKYIPKLRSYTLPLVPRLRGIIQLSRIGNVLRNKIMINPRMFAVWSTTKQIAQFFFTPRVQEEHTKAEVVHLTPGLLGLGVLFNCHA